MIADIITVIIEANGQTGSQESNRNYPLSIFFKEKMIHVRRGCHAPPENVLLTFMVHNNTMVQGNRF